MQEDEDPHEADYYLKGPANVLAAVITLVDNLTNKYGDADDEFGLFVSINILTNILIGSSYYDCNLFAMSTNYPKSIL